jgi:elongation factor G
MYIPSIVAISDTDAAELDFDDMTAIASKMLDPVTSRFLVLHDESAHPVALIDLVTLKILDYSLGDAVMKESDPEHKELVAEYISEYYERIEEAGEDGFIRGLLFPALPWITGAKLGIDQIKELLAQIPTVG